MGQFLGPENDQFCRFLILIVFFRYLANRKRKKKQFERALDFVRVQKEQDIRSFLYFLDPETDIMGQFLGPETDIMGERYCM